MIEFTNTFTRDYLWLYTTFNLMCISLLILTLFRMKYGSVKVPHTNYISKIVHAAIIIIVSDDTWRWVSIAHISNNLTFAWSLNILYFVCMQILYFHLFMYFYVSIIDKPVTNKKYFLMSIPCIFMILINCFDYKHQLLFYVTDDFKYVRGSFYIFEYVIAYSYILLPYVYAIRNVIKSKIEGVPSKKIQRNVITMPATIGVMALIGMWVSYVPLFSIAATITILFLYVDLLEDYVTIDPITTLSTKTEFMLELKNRVALQNVNNRDDLYLIMLDILHLRQINDEYGHDEGDNLIRRVAAIIQRKTVLSDKINIFASRYKGDVFSILINSDSQEDIMNYCTNLQVRISKSDAINMSKYNTEIMYGFSKYKHNESILDFVDDALKNLEMNKFKYEQIRNLHNKNKKET